MKKFAAIFFSLLIMVSIFAVTVSAAPAINTNEQKVLDFLSQTVKLGNTNFKIPSEYITQAKNYFLTIDMTEAQANDVIAHVNTGVEVLKNSAVPNKDFNLKELPHAAKVAVLQAGQDASAVTGCNLTYNASTEKVVITTTVPGSTTPVVIFDSDPIIKKTGADFNASAIILTVSALVLAFSAVVVISKKAKLF